MENDTIIYAGGFELPNKNAATHRAVENRKIFSTLGFNTIILGIDKHTKKLQKIDSKDDYYNWVRPYPKNIFEWLKYLFDLKSVKYLIEHHKNVKVVILYNYPSIALLRVLHYCRKRNITVISDVTEWYGRSDSHFLHSLTKNFDTFLRMRVANKKTNALFVSSKYLKDYYNNQKSIILPMLFSKDVDLKINSIKKPINIVYTGIPFKLGKYMKNKRRAKDRLDLIIRYLYEIHELNFDFTLNVYGITLMQYLEVIPEDKKIIKSLGKKIVFNGYVNSEKIKKIISEADFSILFRDTNRVTLSGFPTKVAESITCGTPVITTDTGDITNYVKDNFNGYIIDTKEKSIAIVQLTKIMNLQHDFIKSLKYNCLNDNSLNTLKWVGKVKNFFIELNLL